MEIRDGETDCAGGGRGWGKAGDEDAGVDICTRHRGCKRESEDDGGVKLWPRTLS